MHLQKRTFFSVPSLQGVALFLPRTALVAGIQSGVESFRDVVVHCSPKFFPSRVSRQH